MNAHDLLALQDLDSAITSIANRRPRLPELAARNAAEADVQRLRARVEAAQRRIDEAQAVIDRSEHENAELVAKKTRLQAQLKTIISPREAEALMHQIEGLDAQIRELDDTELADYESRLAAFESARSSERKELFGRVDALISQDVEVFYRQRQLGGGLEQTHLQDLGALLRELVHRLALRRRLVRLGERDVVLVAGSVQRELQLGQRRQLRVGRPDVQHRVEHRHQGAPVVVPGVVEGAGGDVGGVLHVDQHLEKRRGRHPRHARGDLDGPVLMLASRASRAMTGTTLAVDWGHLVSSL